ncbi:MAG: hypothetical protein LBH32_08015 [Dysgonamonadaceae bacterium]|nr:hypothetical protein [Dysgonamonadaceae bacterium]
MRTGCNGKYRHLLDTVWNVLLHDFELKLANTYFIKQLPGRKSDVKDAL